MIERLLLFVWAVLVMAVWLIASISRGDNDGQEWEHKFL